MKRISPVLAAMLASFMLVVAGSAPTFAADSPAKPLQVGDATVLTSIPIKSEQELDQFLRSSVPKTVEVDVDTGEITSVTEDALVVQPMAAIVAPGCSSQDACLITETSPLVNYGFKGWGVANGSWKKRIQWNTGAHTAQAWYIHPTDGRKLSWGKIHGPGTKARLISPATVYSVNLIS